MTVRSRPLLKPTVLTTAAVWQLLYTCPADRVAIFRTIYVTPSTGSNPLVVDVGFSAATTGNIFRKSMLANAGPDILRDVILEEGDQLYGRCATAANVSISGFGSLLDGDPA